MRGSQMENLSEFFEVVHWSNFYGARNTQRKLKKGLKLLEDSPSQNQNHQKNMIKQNSTNSFQLQNTNDNNNLNNNNNNNNNNFLGAICLSSNSYETRNQRTGSPKTLCLNDNLPSLFDREKKHLLASIAEKTELEQPDRSRAGKIDAHIVTLVDLINRSSHFYTTSSCSGRHLILETAEGMKYGDVAWLLVSHERLGEAFEPISQAIQLHKTRANEKKETASPNSLELWYKLEGFILAVCCRTLSDAQTLLELCRKAGLKRCCITSTLPDKVLVLIVDTQRMETIIALDGVLLVDEQYLRRIAKIADDKLQKSWNKMAGLEKVLSQTWQIF